ncbi:hypothetical protein [Asticcacaulis solisilvae]|uniref:hypothetical protein n=1 Tax=Asticcacaulis solisilvae TaxID=1217274 RepID=UPI003FD7D8A9
MEQGIRDRNEIFAALSAAVAEAFPGLSQGGEADYTILDLLPLTGDKALRLGVWVDEYPSPSLAFGPSHCHEAADTQGYAEIVAGLCKIFADEWVVVYDVGGEHPGHGRWMDLTEPDALADYLTDPYSPDIIDIKSWTGRRDGRFGLSDL